MEVLAPHFHAMNTSLRGEKPGLVSPVPMSSTVAILVLGPLVTHSFLRAPFKKQKLQNF